MCVKWMSTSLWQPEIWWAFEGISIVAHRESRNKIVKIMVVREFINLCAIKTSFQFFNYNR